MSFLSKLFNREHSHTELESQIELILRIQIGMLRRYDIKEEEIARIMTDEKFISELYLNRLVSLLKGDQNDIR